MKDQLKLFNLIFIGILSFQNCFAQDIYHELTNAENIKTVVCYAYNNGDDFSKRYLQSPAASLNSNTNIILEFDDLDANYAQYHARIIHCDKNWQQSKLLDLEILDGFNDFFLNTYEVSSGTKVPYYHYVFRIPRPKISGNFVIQIFKDQLDGELIIQKKIYFCLNL